MILTGPGEFELRPEINPIKIKVRLVYNILNSIIYFGLVCQDKNSIYTTRYIIQTNTILLSMVRYFCMPLYTAR